MSDTLSLILASAAFVVAVVGLYLTNVRRADIDLIQVPRPIWAREQTVREEGPPVRAELQISVAAINSGARPGVITDLIVERTSDRFFVIEGGNPNPNFRDGELGALPVLSGETRVFIVQVTTSFPEESVAGWRSGSFSSFDVTISYTFLRGRKIRRTATRRLIVPVPVAGVARELSR